MITATMVVATIPVTDLERAKQFYGETLGLEFLWETPVAVRFRCGSVSEISVFKRPPISTEHTLAHFEVDDIEAEVAQIWSRAASSSSTTPKGPSTTTEHIAQLGPARCAWFLDPDGNTLGIRQG